MKYETILKRYKSGNLTLEQVLDKLAKNGACPALINDDDGRWALSFDGLQSVVVDGPADVSTSFFVEAKFWKDSVRDAVIFSLEEYL